MYKKILVPLDGSPRGESILTHVQSLASAFDAEVILLGVVDWEPMPAVEAMSVGTSYQAYHHQVDELNKYLTKNQQKLQENGVTATVEVNKGAIVDTIIEAANERDVDLIAMASHGRTGLAQAFYGSVATGVLHQVNRPILLIRSL